MHLLFSVYWQKRNLRLDNFIMVIKSICATRHTTKMAMHSYLYVTVRCHTLRQKDTSVSLVGHLPWPHLRNTSDRQLIREPPAVVADLCGICRSDDPNLFGILFNWTEQKLIQHFYCCLLTSKCICLPQSS